MRTRRALALGAATLIIAHVGAAYLAAPLFWTWRDSSRPQRPFVTRTSDGIPGDPLNVGLIGERDVLLRAMRAAGWFPADPITLRSSIEIVGSVLLDRPYRDAPVSALYYDGRREDLAFEKPASASADRRHHVRFWRAIARSEDGRPLWLGAATFDRGVGVSRTTGQMTHHIAPDIDAERRTLFDDLAHAGMIVAAARMPGSGATTDGRNGEGDPYRTDGELWLMRLAEDAKARSGPPPALQATPDASWRALWRRVAPSAD